MQTVTDLEQDMQRDVDTSSGIIDFVERVQTIQAKKRQATQQERDLLGNWMGWGPIARAFEPDAQGTWAEIGARLRLLLGPEGVEAASAATPTSFFTPRFIAETMWTIATRLGFQGGRVLEPGCGSGAILAAAPSDLSLDITGIEREQFSADIMRLRFPDAKVITAPLEQVSVVHDSFDLVIGNVPFSSVHISDRDASINFSLHNYFLWRALCALRPGGIAVLLTSRYTLDAVHAIQRRILSARGRLLGVLRLPSGAHKETGTQVVTDLLLLQRSTPAIAWQGHQWMESLSTIIPGTAINEYFKQSPQHIIGTPVIDRGMYRDKELRVIAPSNLREALTEAVENLVQQVRSNDATYIPPLDYTTIREDLVRRREDGQKEGSYHRLNGTLVQIVNAEARPVQRNSAELTLLVMLRDTAIELLEAERDLDRPDNELVPIRQRLNTHYDVYVRTYGFIHRASIIFGEADPETGEQTVIRRRPPALSAFRQDPDYCVVLGLEQYDDTTQQAQKAPIFRQRIHVRPQRRMMTGAPGEALALCLDACGRLDIQFIARLLSIDTAEVPARLGDLAYEDPRSATWLTAQEYLSGNIRIKLEEARTAAEDDPQRFNRNVTALEAVMPEDLVPEEIKAVLGAPWIAPMDIEQFCLELLGIRPTVSYEALTSTWEVTLPQYSVLSSAATSEWGTRSIDAFTLIERGLNKTIPVIYTDAGDTQVRNVEETLDAQEKLRSLQARFSDWVWEEDERAERLAALYNRQFNSVVPRTYDGAHLSFPGMAEAWANKLYPWQSDFVWRMVCSPSALCGHPVGAGKTITEIAGIMTMQRLGLITKAAIVVPNHLLEQITAEAQRLYPGARVLMISRDDLRKERRKLFAARIAFGDYDYVVITHSGLSALRVHPDTERGYLEKRIAIYRQALLDIEKEKQENDRRQKRSIKRLETTIEKMRQRQRELLDTSKDGGVTFEQLGVSYLVIDEAHLFKNLGLPTNIQGLQVRPAKRAVDLEMKLRWLEEHNEGRPFVSFFTATPLSNSMVEAYVMAWYLAQDLIRANGLTSVDAFASTFIELQTRVEVSPNGAAFRLHTRPSRFVNIPEFLALFTRFADLRGPEILDGKRPARQEQTITIEPDATVQAYVDDLVERSELIQQGKPRNMGAGQFDNMLWVTTHGRAAALDLSLVGNSTADSLKLKTVASTMLEVFLRVQQTATHLDGPFKSLQIGFCDLGTPNEENEQVYGILKKLLIAGGIPARGIRYVHEAKTSAAKEYLFHQCRVGEVAILLASTQLMGTGTNIQTRCAAIHHIDAPWRPDEVEQREGRGHRPGNLHAVVEIYRYVQQRTFDAYSWQTLTTKAIFSDQMRRGKIKNREIDDLGETALSFAQVKAAATGDPLVLEQAELDVAIVQLQKLQNAHNRARRQDAQEAAAARRAVVSLLGHVKALREVEENTRICERSGFSTDAEQQIEKPARVGAIIAGQLQTLLASNGGEAKVGWWSGTPVTVRVKLWGNKYTAELIIGDDALLIDVSPSWMAKKQQWRFAEAIEAAMNTVGARVEREEAQAEKARKRAEQLEKQAQQQFPRAEELRARLARKMALDEYTSLVAAAKGDPNQQEALAAQRAQLLQETPAFASFARSESVPSSTPASRFDAAIALRPDTVLPTVPLFGALVPAQTKGFRRRGKRQRSLFTEDETNRSPKQLCLFPERSEQVL